MKQFSKALLATAIVFTAAPSFAGYDEFDCRSNNSIKSAGLECITCGIQKYYADKGQEVEVSEKWLTLLALNVQKEFGYNTVRSSTDKESFQKAVIRRIQVYGFCSEYLGKDTLKQGRSRNYKDMSAADWNYFNQLLNRDYKISDKQMEEAAEKLGFNSGGWFSSKSSSSMTYLFEGMFEELSYDAKRALFKEKLKQALAPDYNVSGEKVQKDHEFIAKGDKDQGLKKCLADIERRFFKNQLTDKEGHGFCATMANSCDLPRVNLDSKNDFCIHSGMALKPAGPTKQPPVFGGNPDPSRPTPPGVKPHSSKGTR